MLNRKVAIFDSGAGGLSITRHILEKSRDFDFIYIADRQGFPYGALPEHEIIYRVESLIAKTIDRYHPDIVILACNTASTVTLDHLRQRFDIPFIGVVPAIKPAAVLSNTQHIAVLATSVTAKSSYLQNLVTQFANDKHVSIFGNEELVSLCETFVAQGRIDENKLKHIILSIFEHDDQIDALVLACTHFPLIRETIEQMCIRMKRKVQLIDSTDAIYRRLLDLTPSRHQNKVNSVKIIILSTGNTKLSEYEKYLSTAAGLETIDFSHQRI